MITQNESQKLESLLTSLLPDSWFTGPPTLTIDDEEILIVGVLSETSPGDLDVSAFRESTRKDRMHIAEEIQPELRRSVSWGVKIADEVTVFTSLGVPVMTRLRIHEREALDTLVAAGVARSRSEAAAWCVKFLSQREADWLRELRSSLESVSKVRSEGPAVH
jgi:hypothetical protein